MFFFFDENIKLNALLSICTLVDLCLPYRLPQLNLYTKTIQLIEDLSMEHEIKIDFNNLKIIDIHFGLGGYYDNDSYNFYMGINEYNSEENDIDEVKRFLSIISKQLHEKIKNNSKNVQNWFDNNYMNYHEAPSPDIFTTIKGFDFKN